MLKHTKKITAIMLACFSISTFADKSDSDSATEPVPDAPSKSEQKPDTSAPSDQANPISDANNKKDIINITVSIDAKAKAAGIGYSVDGEESGGPGSVYKGVGPSNKAYSFGYRKGLKESADISCGTLTLTQDSNVTLVVDEEGCHSSIE